MSELEKVNKFVAKVSPKGEPKLFYVSPINKLVKAYTEDEAQNYIYSIYDQGTGIIKALLVEHMEIKEVKLVDLTEGDGTHSKVDI